MMQNYSCIPCLLCSKEYIILTELSKEQQTSPSCVTKQFKKTRMCKHDYYNVRDIMQSKSCLSYCHNLCHNKITKDVAQGKNKHALHHIG